MNTSNKDCLVEKKYPAEFTVNSAGALFRKLCLCAVNCDKTFRVDMHRKTAKHKKAMPDTTAPATSAVKQVFLPVPKKNFKKLVEAFLAAGAAGSMPLNTMPKNCHKLKNL